MSRGGPPYRGDRDYYSSRYGSEYGSSSRSYWSSGQPSDRSEGEDARLARYEREREWARYDRERYERERYDRERAYTDRRDPYEDRRWDERDRADPRRYTEGREYRDPREADRYAGTDSRYSRSSYYDRGYRDLDAAERSTSAVDPRAERDLAYQRQSSTWRRSPSPSHRSKSPRSVSRRSTPSSSRRPSPPPHSAAAGAERTPSSATFASAARRDSATGIPSGPREYTDRDRERERLRDREMDRDAMQQPPTGPRSSFARPPPSGPSGGSNRAPPSKPRASYDEQSYFSRTPGRGSYEDSHYNRSLSRTYDRSPYANAPSGSEQNTPSVRAPPATTPTGPRRESSQRDLAHLQVPTRSPAHVYSSSSAGVGSGATTPAAVNGTPEKVSSRKASFAEGLRVRGKSNNLQLEQKINDLSVDRIAFTRKIHANPAMESLRKALHELADSDVELAGARLKSSLTEAALEKAKEEAEAWSIESARIELEQRNSGPQGYWNVV
ncbi:uncharacterized protein FA14DRAFT_175714 [Meira miltonrushii]|uniref:Uncharacterized protein n=1 Tax=Meira miltonrushii TaxID=1280837 RepID=A0A316V111_9BASI|nr:uncharacterized protein FA14DRAFT_175714 [Meira miltonrushii]PWN31236.1 hypothetical protein FA14DRAFT_175714 [Meira miltonrushii]